jgi:hypothetical protein
MTDRSRQQIIPPPSGTRLPAAPPPRPSIPSMPTGGGVALTQMGQLRKDGQYLTLYSAKLRALADNAVAMRELVEKRDALAMAIANLHSLPERCAHQYEMGRLSRHNELELARLNAEHDQLQAKIRNAAAQMQLAQYLPIAVRDEPPPSAPARAPAGLTPADVRSALQQYPDIKPEAIEPLIMMLTGILAEKCQ